MGCWPTADISEDQFLLGFPVDNGRHLCTWSLSGETIAVLCHILECRNVTQEMCVDYLLVFQYWVWRASHHFPEFIISLHGKSKQSIENQQIPEKREKENHSVNNSHATHQVAKFIQVHAEAALALLIFCFVLLDFLLIFFPHHPSVSFLILEINTAGNISFLLTLTQADQMKCRDR